MLVVLYCILCITIIICIVVDGGSMCRDDDACCRCEVYIEDGVAVFTWYYLHSLL